MKIVAFCSGGNDSIALIQKLHNDGHQDVVVAYNETHWAHPDWPARMDQVRAWVESLGYTYAVIESEGFENLIRRKKGFPMAASNMSFCTMYLKTLPSKAWLNDHNPERSWICCAGVRREESQNRADHPEWIRDSDLYDGRPRWFPLVGVKEPERDLLVQQAGFEVLPHGSMECFPCINSNRKDLRILAEVPERIETIATMESDLGYTRKGKRKNMFRPYRHMGAEGVHEVVKWALCRKGQYKKSELAA